MRRMDWLNNKKDEILELYKEKTQVEIAEIYGVSQTAISTRLRKWGKSNPDGNRFRRFDDIDKDTVNYLYWEKEMHPSQIAEIYGCHKQVITNRMLEWGIPFRTKSEARMGKLNPIYNVGHSEETRKKMSEAFYNGTRDVAVAGTWGTCSLYDTPNQGPVVMRSSWEVKTADYLTGKGIVWYYEYKWIDLGIAKYLPDFYLSDFNTFLEVKGRKSKVNMDKIKRAKALGNKIIVWDGEELLKRGIIDQCGVTEINRKYRNTEPFVDNWESYKK